MKFVIVLCIIFKLAIAKPVEETVTCGYESCNIVDTKKINIHLVPHSHDDVGWLKTVDQYYYGARNNIQYAGVQHIIGSVVQALQKDPNRRFIQVETAFFWQWWQRQSLETKEITRRLVNSGRLEIVNGAWSMNDEAAAHYHSIIDQFTWGLKRINDTLGRCGRPKIGWQIDPFGHSKEMASLFSQIGYEAVFFARLDYRDSARRHEKRELEMIWRGSDDLGNSSDIFTGVLYDFYTAPAYFCWDVLCTDTPIIDDPASPDYNVEAFVDRFSNYIIKGLKSFKSNNLLVTMGGDFTYQAAEMYFTNMDRLIEGFKTFRPNINVIYSTPSCYLKAVNNEAIAKHIEFPLKTDDFFPYASNSHSYWTGYFTSRPNSKRFERLGNNLLQVAKQLISFAKYNNNFDVKEDLILLKEVMGIMQHHDAITGTEKQHVANDYVRILTDATRIAENNLGDIITDLLKKTGDINDVKIEYKSCLLSNVSVCEQSGFDRFTIAVYNPLSRYINYYVRLPVDGESYTITGPNGTVNYEILPTISDFAYMDREASRYELVFPVEKLPPLGLKYFYIEKSSEGVRKNVESNGKKTRFGNENAGFVIDKDTGLLSSVTLSGITLGVRQEFLYYNGANGTNKIETDRASGAYIFRPANTTPEAVPITKKVTYTTYSTDMVEEVHQTFNEWVRQIIRVYKNENHIEFDWLVGPIEIINKLGVEVISRFTTNIASAGIFYTDSNGRQTVERRRDFRKTYDYTPEEPVSANYYPVTSKIILKDNFNDLLSEQSENQEFAILTDRAQGGSSLEDGQVELMIHRRLLNDDAFGVGEALNELEFNQGVVVRGQHYLTFAKKANAVHDAQSNQLEEGALRKVRSPAADQRELAQRKLLSPWVFIGDATSNEHTLDNLKKKLNFEFSGLTRALPENIEILTLEPWNDDTLLLRLEHTFSKNEDDSLSQPVVVNIKNLFAFFDIVTIEEMNLAANIPIDEIEKMSWNKSEIKKHGFPKVIDFKVILNPMEIRTFIIKVISVNPV